MIGHFLWQRGPVLITCGLLVIVAGQFSSAVPIVTGIALIGRGAIVTLQSRPRTIRQDSLALLNLCVYGTLVCLAIVAQSNAILQTSGRMSLGMLLDHSAAIVILLGLTWRVFFQISQPTN
jgi:hypothetical protein